MASNSNSYKAKRFVFTLNNYSDEEESELRLRCEAHGSYAIIGREVGDLELHTSKDSSFSEIGLFSAMRRIDLTLDAMSRSLKVLHDRTELIVQNQVVLGNMVSALQVDHHPVSQPVTTNVHVNSFSPWSPGTEALLDSLMNIQEDSSSLDITCYETMDACNSPLRGPIYKSTGTMENPVRVSPERPMKKCQMDM